MVAGRLRGVAWDAVPESMVEYISPIFLTIERLVVLSALAWLALFGAPNARDYLCHSMMHILPLIVVSGRMRIVKWHCVQYSQIQIEPRYDHLRMNLFQNQSGMQHS
jgi:hypothetical protein